ncbi:phosphonoacetaldehyde hydrolase [Terasakiella pusilla]|uniref:phosphonoacetaldehyde hydrolase n=1 Tax=Terasakiella pusilla TaxID=64973 RepID=UPI003AA9193C
MTFTYQRSYRGPLKAAVLDWAGTVMDHGCRAPAAVFQAVFEARGITVSEAQAREPMGRPKWDHIYAVGTNPAVNALWKAKFGKDFEATDADEVYKDFVPHQISIIADYCDMIPGTVDAVHELRAMGMKIGSCTGYTPDIMEACRKAAKTAGYVPDAIFCAGDTPKGRPGPALLLANMIELDVYPPQAVVKIGDTVADVEEGLNAGAWTIAVAARGNEVGLSREAFEAMEATQRQALIDAASEKLSKAGAHYVVDSIADVPAVVEEINARLSYGDHP